MAATVAGTAAALLAAYLIGGIPGAYVVGRLARGVDIREHGSGNVGTTNAFRVLGPWPALWVLIIDIAKGAVAVLVAPPIFRLVSGAIPAQAAAPEYFASALALLAALAAIAGHTYTPFLAFRGGKGIATAAGALLVLTPIAVLILIALFATIVLATRLVSLASIVIALLYPPLVYLLYRDVPGALAIATLAAALVIWRHRSNIGRLARGEERKIVWKRDSGEGGGT